MQISALPLIGAAVAAASIHAAQPTDKSLAKDAGVPLERKAGSGLSAEGAGLSANEASLSAKGSSLTGNASSLGARESELGTTVSLSADLLFDFDKAELKPAAIPRLQQLLDLIKQRKPRQVRIHGHTDAKGSEDYNLQLSRRRADAVADWLASKGIGRALLASRGFGEASPVAPNQKPDGSDDPEGRQKNRRVDVLLAKAFVPIMPLQPRP